MVKNRVWLRTALLSLSLLMLASPGWAWEFSMDGTFTWEYEYRTQSGRQGFFGPYDVDAGNGASLLSGGGINGRYASVNAWLGFQSGVKATQNGMVTGADASWNTMYMLTNMDLRVNPAIRIRGTYYIGEWAAYSPSATAGSTFYAAGDLVASEYLNYRYDGIQRSFSPGYWNTLWMTAELPWGIITLGKRPSIFGMGLGWNGAENRSSENFSLFANYGPLRIGWGFYPSRRGYTGLTSVVANPIPEGQPRPQSATTTQGDYFNVDYDKSGTRVWDMGPTITYRAGNVDIGFTANVMRRHRGLEGILPTAEGTGNNSRFTVNGFAMDYDESYGGLYVKYNNGRFFLNSEVDWFENTTRRRAFVGGVPRVFDLYTSNAVGTQDQYLSGWRAATELGVMCGPGKISALYAWLSGPDRRYGRQIDRTGLFNSTSFSNTGMFRPYSYLMVYGYGTGLYFNNATGNGYAEDASIWAGRLDYAVAANLNVYGSFAWADRVTKSGYGYGVIRPIATGTWRTDAAAGTTAITNGVGDVRWFVDPTNYGAPSIPDTNLGWEIDAGFDWKLLEGLVVNGTFAYWQPGKWFNYACVDKSVPDWGRTTGMADVVRGPNEFAYFGINPNRNIDPIFGTEIRVNAEF